jgi:hypothetical protein
VGTDAELVKAAKAVLDANWTGGSTVPSRDLYPHQWSWDSTFIAIGRSWYDQERVQGRAGVAVRRAMGEWARAAHRLQP